jgi:hypothetical protein
VLGALKAPLPKDTIRTVYLCDDGKDPTKEEMVRELNNEWGCLEYVSGRKRDPNGESTQIRQYPAQHSCTRYSAHAEAGCHHAVALQMISNSACHQTDRALLEKF